MSWAAKVILLLALVEAGWLAFDGTHALVRGDYVTPSTGAHALQLGPWSQVVSAVGIPPRSTLMKWIHVVLGIGWLGICFCFFLRQRWAWKGMLIGAVLSLWYLPFGTLLSLLQIVLLLTSRQLR